MDASSFLAFPASNSGGLLANGGKRKRSARKREVIGREGREEGKEESEADMVE